MGIRTWWHTTTGSLSNPPQPNVTDQWSGRFKPALKEQGWQGQGQNAQQYKYTQNARNASTIPPNIPQHPPQAHLMAPPVGQQSGQTFPSGVAPLPLQQPPPGAPPA